MAMIIRFVDVISNPESEIAAAASIKEHFLGFVPLNKTSSAVRRDVFIYRKCTRLRI
jgi:hypothetical protein